MIKTPPSPNRGRRTNLWSGSYSTYCACCAAEKKRQGFQPQQLCSLASQGSGASSTKVSHGLAFRPSPPELSFGVTERPSGGDRRGYQFHGTERVRTNVSVPRQGSACFKPLGTPLDLSAPDELGEGIATSEKALHRH